jgi:hypothetical protein
MENYIGYKNNYWEVISMSDSIKGQRYVKAKCKCGTVKNVNLKSIRYGKSKSCGCYRNTLYKKTKFGKGNPKWKGGKTINSQGYIEIRVEGSYVKEHRYVYEQNYGIKLLPHQNIHHINGDRLDNRIENLELWDTSQPAGQRVEDKILFYKELYEKYKDYPNYKKLF